MALTRTRVVEVFGLLTRPAGFRVEGGELLCSRVLVLKTVATATS